MIYTLILPLSVPVSKSKDFVLNLNIYRNAHYQTLNKAKISFKESVSTSITQLPNFNKIKLTYTLYTKNKIKKDISNILSIVDKFLSDALVELGKLPDDNYTYIPEVKYQFGSIDKDNPRVEVNIEEF